MFDFVDRTVRRFRGTLDTFTIDPFAWWPGARSRITGIGGTVAVGDPDLVFHSSYHAFAGGRVTFTVRFDGLAATTGTLRLQINAMTTTDPEAILVKQVRVDLSDLAQRGGAISVSVPARDGRAFAVYAQVIGDTDASASAVTIQAEGDRATAGPSPRLSRAARIFVYDPAEPLTVDEPATLARPWSQMCTIAQFDEPEYREWAEQLNVPLHRHRKQWEFIYICRMLEHLEILQPHSRGLGFGCGKEPLPAVFANRNIFVTATDLSPEAPEAAAWHAGNQWGGGVVELRRPGVTANEIFDARVEFQFADMNAIPDTLRDYDFTWSSCALEHLGSIEAGLTFIERSLETLRPGGVAIHTTELNLASDDDTIEDGQTVLFRRKDILRLAHRLTNLGHVVHPISFDIGSTEVDRYVDVPPYTADPHLKLALGKFVTTSFGLAIRKAG